MKTSETNPNGGYKDPAQEIARSLPMTYAMDMVRDLLALSHVPRWVTHPVHRPQSVAEHSYRVTVIAMYIAGRCGNLTREDRYDIMFWSLVHDGPEAKTGDVPSPLKQHIKQKLSSIEMEVCPWFASVVENFATDGENHTPMIFGSIADTIEAYSWLRRYGHGFKDRFDTEQIEHKLSRRIWTLADQYDETYPGLADAVKAVMQEVG